MVDHCHEHGFIRGELCTSHNGRIDLLTYDPQLAGFRERCPDCAASAEPEYEHGESLLGLALIVLVAGYAIGRWLRPPCSDQTEPIVGVKQ